MRFRDIAPTITVICSLVAAIWSPLAWAAFYESFRRGFQPGFEHTTWTNFEGLFGLSVFLFLPSGFFAHLTPDSETVGLAIGGAIEGAVVGAILSLIVAAAYNRWKPTTAAI